MKLKIGDTEYLVRFYHETRVIRFTQAFLLRVIDERTTEAVELTPGNPLSVFAFCHKKDNFSKVTGRKIAFGRLLEAMEKVEILTGTKDALKDLRTYCWEEYLKNFKVR